MYDVYKSYLQNYCDGPTAEFVPEHFFPKIKYVGVPKFQFLGIPLFIPFGVPAGPLLNSKFIRVALDAGFCLPTYKTVRSFHLESHPWPNILKIHSKNEQIFSENEIPNVMGIPFEWDDYFKKNLSISNSFGVPSQIPDIWSNDFETLKSYSAKKGFHVVLSFQGSNIQKNLFDDTEKTCEFSIETVQKTGFCVLEVNLSCPNEVNEPLYKSLNDSVKALKSINKLISEYKNIKLIAKIGALNFEKTYAFVSETSPYIHAISAINTVLSKISDPKGNIVLGSRSLMGGVCGAVILNQGLLMCENLSKSREKCGIKSEQLGLIGVGGVSEFTHFKNYRDAGADVVQAATGMMWNLNLAKDIATGLKVSFEEDKI